MLLGRTLNLAYGLLAATCQQKFSAHYKYNNLILMSDHSHIPTEKLHTGMPKLQNFT